MAPSTSRATGSAEIAGVRDACLQYHPAVVSLTGTLERRTYPGRPDYESIKKGDEPETHFYMKLRRSVCTSGNPQSPDAYPQHDVNLVQLVLEPAGYRQLRPKLGRNVTLRGLLYAQHTGHHHAPLLLRNVVLMNDAR